MRLPLGTKIFAGTAFVVVAALGAALVVTKIRANSAADAASERALRATEDAIGDALVGRSRTLRQLAAALVQVPAYVSRIGEALRANDRANLLDQSDELRRQTGADWVLITDGNGVLKAWTAQRNAYDQDFSRGALIGRALEGQTTEGLWLEPGPAGDELFQAVGVPATTPGVGTPFGVVVAALRVDSALAGVLKRHTNSEIVFFSRDTLGVPQVAISTLAVPNLKEAVQQLPMDSGARDTTARRFRLGTAQGGYEGIIGVLRTADGIPVGGYLGLHSRETELVAYRQLSRAIGWAFAGGLLLALASSVILARQITRPVQRLVQATRQVTEGSYTAPINVPTTDEIGELAGAFSRMIEELKEKDRLVEYLQTGGHPAGTVTQPRYDGLLAVGARFASRYDIQELLGSGGMGVVYRAFDREVGETVALKALRSELSGMDPRMLERFKQELRLARRIAHRNVVRTYDLGESDGIYYITMEFVHGTTLAVLIRDAGRLAVPAALTIGKQLCRALEVAHEEGIIHRDIKPQNLLVDPAGFLKVMDFGIARLSERLEGGQTLTAHGLVVGTPQYMAPEQLFGELVDARADLYSTGAVLFECVTGRPVYEAPTVMALLSRHLVQPPADPATLNPDVSAALSKVILRALARRPDDRWASAKDLLHALEAI
ncbi:MAG TPA: protein kinase [Gemmatimonadales bacterium]|jgi:serine/threonine-protein kinase